jgi:hypothetical protein
MRSCRCVITSVFRPTVSTRAGKQGSQSREKTSCLGSAGAPRAAKLTPESQLSWQPPKGKRACRLLAVGSSAGAGSSDLGSFLSWIRCLPCSPSTKMILPAVMRRVTTRIDPRFEDSQEYQINLKSVTKRLFCGGVYSWRMLVGCPAA